MGLEDILYYFSDDRLHLLAIGPEPNQSALLKVRRAEINSISSLISPELKTVLVAALSNNGRSIQHGKSVASLLDIKSVALVSYDLKSLNHVQKTLFGYALKGRTKGQGILSEMKGRVVGRNSVLIPSQYLSRLQAFLKQWKVPYEYEVLLKP
ncbi:hypothetical protein J4475_01925 [Candidatus Woesearchaeota archaeon]|nr:hypothetical protein [Candidatus Woesearchaeota archaeon]